MTVCIIMLNLIAFAIFGYDKLLAKNNQRRISENILLSLSFLGGTVGAILGMLIFRHKISKKSFLLKFVLIIFLQIIIIYFLKQESIII